jgi:putative serine protease PepD
MTPSVVRIGAVVVISALVGAGAATAISASQGASNSTTTITKVVHEQSSQPSGVAQTAAPHGLTIGQIYDKARAGVVLITATSTVTAQNPLDPFGPPQKEQQQALGSGFVIDRQGHILTNAHVVVGASKVQVGFGGTGAKTYQASVVGLDKAADIAVLKVDLPGSALQPLTLGNSSAVHVGDPVVAIGNPLGETQTVTSGIVSAVQRQISSLAHNQDIYGAIQTDAAINHGNSGGPLLNSRGQVIGITSQILSSGSNGGSIGIGFAIPIDTAKQVADQIINTGHAQQTYLGIEGVPLTSGVSQALNIPSTHGVLVARVAPGSPAAKAGIRGGNTTATTSGQTYVLGGDVIVSLNGKAITTFSDLAEPIQGMQPGTTVTLGVLRDGKQRTVKVVLASRSS